MNTNRQNRLYYGTSDICPCCNSAKETFALVLSCLDEATANHCSTAFNLFLTQLKFAGTPIQVLDAITYGTHHWLGQTDPSTVHALTAGSLHAGDTILTTAFIEQFHSIGRYQMFLGRLSAKWEKAYATYKGKSMQAKQTEHWSSLLVTLLWTYTKSLWDNRNAILHGSTGEETAKLRFQMLQNKLSSLYHTSSIDPGFILPRHHYLFQIKSLPQCLESSYDDMQFFTRFVTEAQHILQHHEDELWEESRWFLHSKDRSDTSYSPSTASRDSSTSLTTTTDTETSSIDSTVTYLSLTSSPMSPHNSTMQSSSHSNSTNLSSTSSSTPTVISWVSAIT
jgi:hypothetical protein